MIHPRRRNRNTYVCTFCKRRKTRCDKGSPCSTCVRYKNPNCEYQSEPLHGSGTRRSSDENGYADSVLKSDINDINDMDRFNGFNRSNSNNSKNSNSKNSNGSNNSVLKPDYSDPNTDYSMQNGLSTSFAYASPTAAPSSLYSELDMLREKILMLENSVQLSSTTESTPLVWASSADYRHYLLGYNPYVSGSETFSFHGGYTPFLSMGLASSRHYGPLSWISLIKIDNSVSRIFAYINRDMVKRMAQHQYRMENNPASAVDSKPSDSIFLQKIVNSDSFTDQQLYKNFRGRTSPSDKPDVSKTINERAKAVGLTFHEGGIDSRLELVDKLMLVLPAKRVIWLLVDRFFSRVYMFFPFLDETDFTENIVRILGPRSNLHEKIEKLNVERKSDLVHLGILLLVLRFGYLTLFTNSDSVNEMNLKSNDPSPNAQEIKYLLANPIDIDTLEVAEMCLNEFSFLRFCNIPLLQLALYIKLYYMFAPENGEVPEDSHSQACTALLINMAISLGFHREPDNFETEVRDLKTNNLCRKIWYYLLILDLQGAMSNGLPLCASRDTFDTKLPFYTPGNENSHNIETEKLVAEAFSRFEHAYEPMCRLTNLIVSVGKRIAMSELCALLNSLELDYIKDYEYFKCDLSALQGNAGVLKAVRTKVYFQGSFFLVSICFHFFNHYETLQNMDLAYFYLKKVIVISIFNMMPFYQDYIEKSDVLFENSTDITITPGFQSLVHKCMIVIQSVIVRARFSILFFEQQSTHMDALVLDPEYKRRYDLLKNTYSLSNKCLKVFVDTLSKLSSRYYYSWRCIKAQECLQKARSGTDYYLQYCKGKECCMKLTNDMLEDLNMLLQKSLARVSENKKSSVNVPITPDEPFQASDMSAAGSDSNYGAFANNEQVDNLWMQMISLKPQLTKGGMFSRTPPSMDIDVGLGTFGSLDNFSFGFNEQLASFSPGPDLAGLSFLDSQNLDELVGQDL